VTVTAPRPWQAAFLKAHAASAVRDFLLVATPGAGKTLAACLAARAAGCDQVIVVCPTTALRAQWADAADVAGLHLDPRWRNADGAWRADVDGVVVTYQQVASAPDLFAHHLSRSTFVVLDEVHHAGEAATWGTALRTAFEHAPRVLALSGTPFRSDARAIPFVRYDDERRCDPDFVYGYGASVADEVCRPLAFRLLDATLRWRVDAQETIAAFADELEPRDDARRLRTAIDPATPLLPNLLRDADALLTKARTPVPDAAGLVLCDDRAHARATAALLRTIAGEKPVVVVSDEAGAHGKIERFARGRSDAPRWLVAVNMVSEGIDVPRLIVAAYATVRRTDLFFRQAVGRVVRRRAGDPEDLVATVFLPADPTLTQLAERVEVELRQQVSDEVGAAYEVEPPLGVALRPDFQALDAVVEPGGMIVAGVHYAPPEVASARRLLRELGQSERSLRTVLEFVRRESVGGGASPAGPEAPAVPAHRRVEAKRRGLDRLARRWAQLRREIDPAYSWPQAQARVNRAMRVARRTDAGERELDDGLAFLRRELAKLAAQYPEEAQRLRILESVEVLDPAM
jgi:superfamily II DNA or RNA helicase